MVRIDVMQSSEIFKGKLTDKEKKSLDIDSGYISVYRIPGGKQVGKEVRKLQAGEGKRGEGEDRRREGGLSGLENSRKVSRAGR